MESTTKDLFLDALKHVLRRKRPPLGISQINDEMRKLDRSWNINRYGWLLPASDRVGLRRMCIADWMPETCRCPHFVLQFPFLDAPAVK